MWTSTPVIRLAMLMLTTCSALFRLVCDIPDISLDRLATGPTGILGPSWHVLQGNRARLGTDTTETALLG